MKTIFLYTCLCFLSSAALISQNNWYEQNSGTNKFLTDIHFIDQHMGWISGWTGTILYTDDGGEQWTPLAAPPTNAYETLFFINELEGWAAGYAGKLVHTSDGGDTWDEQNSGTDYSIYDMQFINSDTGWMVSSLFGGFTNDPARRIHGTVDGGSTWTLLFGEYDEPPLLAIHFPTMNVGFAVGETGTILRSIDGGSNWTELMYDNSYHFKDVFFIDEENGWVVGEDLSLDHRAVIFKTTDGGDTWNMQSFDEDQSLQGVFFTNAEVGWAVGGGSGLGGIILYTSDGGENWEYQDNGGALSLSSVFFADEDHGWAVGYDGTIVAYDGTVTNIYPKAQDRTGELIVNNYPNPFRSTTQLEYFIDSPQHVTITFYDAYGRKVDTFHEYHSPGLHKFIWEADHLVQGKYYYTLRTATSFTNGKLMKIK